MWHLTDMRVRNDRKHVDSSCLLPRLDSSLSSAASSTPIPSASWHDFVYLCLEEAPKTGECTDWASGNNYGTMPNWDTSLVEDMSGYTGSVFQGFGDKSTFNGDISKWNTEKVTNMYDMFYQASAFNQDIGSWNTAQVTDMNICLSTLLRSTTTFPRGPEPQRRQRKRLCFPALLRFKRNLSAPTPSPVRRIRA